jgi:hypothetical protein
MLSLGKKSGDRNLTNYIVLISSMVDRMGVYIFSRPLKRVAPKFRRSGTQGLLERLNSDFSISSKTEMHGLKTQKKHFYVTHGEH